MRTLTVIFLLFVLSLCYSQAYAQKHISYNYLEVGYGHLSLGNNTSPSGIYLDGSYGISDHFYVGGHYESRADRGLDFDRYDLTLGFHTNGSGATDFYIDMRIGDFAFDNVDGQSSGFFAGTRTSFGERFELISKLGFIHVSGLEHPDGDSVNIYESSVKGLFKFRKNQAISTSLESLDGKFGFRLGYRYSF